MHRREQAGKGVVRMTDFVYATRQGFWQLVKRRYAAIIDDVEGRRVGGTLRFVDRVKILYVWPMSIRGADISR